LTVEILRIHEYLKQCLPYQNGLLVLVPPNFKTDISIFKGRTECLFEVFLRLRRRNMARIAKSIRAAIDHFLRPPLHNKPFSNISDQAKRI